MIMKKMVWFTCITIFLLIFILPGLMASLIDMVPASDQPGYGGSKRVSIYGERDFTQHFVSKDKNLVALATSIKNPNLKNKKEIFFNLFDENDNLLRSTSLNGMNIGDGDFVKFVFDKISDSKDIKYYFTLTSPDAGQEEIIEVFLIEPTNEVLTYTYDEETRLGGIPLVTFHKPESKWKIVKDVYVNWFSKLLPLGFQKT